MPEGVFQALPDRICPQETFGDPERGFGGRNVRAGGVSIGVERGTRFPCRAPSHPYGISDLAVPEPVLLGKPWERGMKPQAGWSGMLRIPQDRSLHGARDGSRWHHSHHSRHSLGMWVLIPGKAKGLAPTRGLSSGRHGSAKGKINPFGSKLGAIPAISRCAPAE